MDKFWKFLIFLFIINKSTLASINPMKNPHICGRPICEDIENGKLRYGINSKFEYNYKMHIKSEFFGSGQNTSDLYLTGYVELIFPKNCEGILRLSQFELRENPEIVKSSSESSESGGYDYDGNSFNNPETELHENSEKIAEDIERYDLRFSFHDGLIGEICPEINEPVWVLNFKRGILSAFQNTMIRFDMDYNTTETDVSGSCNVLYSLQGLKGTNLLIQKTKNLQSCRNRYQMNSILQTTPYEFRKNYAAWPILKSESYCDIAIDHNIYNNVKCYERHQLVPFSNDNHGAITESTITLELSVEDVIDRISSDDQEPIEKRTTLLFDHTPTIRSPTSDIKVTRELLKKMCEIGYPDIQRGFPEVFQKFLVSAKYLSFSALQQLLNRASGICSNGRDHFLESLSYIGTPASVQLMKEQIVQNQISQELAQSWVTSLSFITRPDKNIVDAMHSLMEYGKSKNLHSFTLGASAIAHTFCRQNEDCINETEIETIIKYLENDIDDHLPNVQKRENRERVIVSLKALGNIGIISEYYDKVLINIIEDDRLNMEIRLQALSVFRRLDCDLYKNYFIDTYRNLTVQPEIRIGSYLQAMKCPDYQSLNIIKEVLETEEVNQVGSFVWSHLKNIAESASPVRVFAQGLLIGDDLNDKFKLDIRKFSRNFEKSVFFDEYNFGANADANLIFATDSYLPRTLSVNLTFDLFGESVNIFELNSRVQGFDKFLESYFGPKGPINAKRFMKKYEEINLFIRGLMGGENLPTLSDLSQLQDPANLIEIAQDIKHDFVEFNDEEYSDEETIERANQKNSYLKKNLENRVNEIGYDLKYNHDDPRAAFGIKVFGNDLQYHTIEGLAEVYEVASKFNPNSLTKLLTEKAIGYTKSGIILDADYTVPLSSGLPLSLSALGTSSVDARLSGLWNNPDFKNTQKLDVTAKVKPSVSVDVLSTMKSDFFYATSGIQVKSNLYSSFSIEANLTVRGTKLIALKLNLPQDRNEIFSARSELLVMKPQGDIKQVGISKRFENSTCTWPIVEHAFGLQICADYKLPDISNSTEYPSLFLSGPVDLDIHLDKADLTAKTFVFEYRSDKTKLLSKQSFIFETPESQIQRRILANITSDPELMNGIIIFEHGSTKHSAIGSYKNSEFDKRLEFYLDLNEEKYFELEIGMNKTNIRNGAVYYPRFFLTVRKDKIAGLTGIVRKIEKNSKLQYDLQLIFETKKLQSQLNGYLSKTEVTYSSNLTFDYRFSDTQREYINIETEFSDRTNKGQTKLIGYVKHESTAYPKYNFLTNVQFITALGHIELKFDINNSKNLIDPDQTLTIKLTFARQLEFTHGRTKFQIDVYKPKSNTDLKFLIRHDETLKNGTENNFLVIIRYAPKREATAVISIYEPLKQLYSIDVTSNITMAGFEPCTLSFALNEIKRKDYSINLKGQWFTGHALSAKGSYQDRSSYIKTFHHLKFFFNSPSFSDTNIDFRYSRDKREFRIDTQVEYGVDQYGLILRNVEENATKLLHHGEVKWKDQTYWVTSTMLYGQPKQLILEVHIDKERDVHLVLHGISTEEKKAAGLELKWNANRDPTQKLLISAEFNNPKMKVYNGEFHLTYPNRAFNGLYDLDIRGPEYHGNTRVSWSINEALEFSFGSGTRTSDAKNIWLWIKVNTPFNGWRNNYMSSGIYYKEKLLMINSSLLWADTQNIGVEFAGEYELTPDLFEVEIKTALNSSLKDVPSLSAYIKHNHNPTKINTDLTFRKIPTNEEIQLFSVKSAWQFHKDSFHRNITGTIGLKTPYEGYKEGALVSKLSLNENKELLGAADLELESKKYTMIVNGHIKKITDCMLMVNVTTPIEKFRNVIGRFGVNEREKHFVAEVRSPDQALGAEVLFLIHSSRDFNIKFSLETPLEAFNKILLIGKIKPKTVDFRGGWNKFLIGFVGIWRFDQYYDFEYSYKAYTPIPNYEENGVVARFIKGRTFDLELSIKFAQYKLGTLILGQPKPELLTTLQLDAPFKVYSDLFKDLLQDENLEEEFDYSDEEEIEKLSLTVYMELDIIVVPTIKGDLRLAEVDSTYLCVAVIDLPHGPIEISDRFYYPDMLNIKNELIVKTPFEAVKEIKSVYQSSVFIFKSYTIGLDISVLNVDKKIESGFYFNLKNSTDESDLQINDIILNIKTPIQNLPRLNLKTIVEADENLWRANFTGTTLYTTLSLAGTIEYDVNFVDSAVGFSLATPLVPSYSCKVFLKKDFSEVENTLNFGFDLNDNGVENKLSMESMWNIDVSHYVNARAKFNTNLLPLKSVETAVLLTKTPQPMASIELGYIDGTDDLILVKAIASRNKESVLINVVTPMPDFRNITVRAILSETQQDGDYKVSGNLYRNEESYQITGTTTIDDEIPRKVDIILKPTNGGTQGAISYSLEETNDGHNLKSRVFRGDRYAQLHVSYDIFSKISWNYNVNVKSSESQIREIIFNANSQKINEYIEGKYNLKTPWRDLGIDSVKLNTEVKISSYSGEVSCDYELAHVKSNGKSTWSWLPGEDMHVSLISHTDRTGYPHKMFEAGAKYKNPQQNFAQTAIGAHINVNSLWKISLNGTLSYQAEDLSRGSIVFILPEPAADTHTIEGTYRGKTKNSEIKTEHNYALSMDYNSLLTKNNYELKAEYDDEKDLLVLLLLNWGDNVTKKIEAVMKMERDGDKRTISSKIASPAYADEDTFKLQANYDLEGSYHHFIGEMFVPASKQVANADIQYLSLDNTKGNVKCNTPFLNITWIKCDYDFSTTSDKIIKIIKTSWPNDIATFESYQNIFTTDDNTDIDGDVTIEVPLQTRHLIKINYNLNEKLMLKIGNTSVVYNGNNVINGNYKLKTENSTNFTKDIVDISIENTWKPIGIYYVHSYDETNIKFSHDIKHAELFELNNADMFNITTIFHNKTTATGQDFKLYAIHPNRTVILQTEYDYQDSTTKQRSKIDLGPNVWVAYDYNSKNMTKDDEDSHIFTLDLSYPKRNLTADGFYTSSSHSFDSKIEFMWKKNTLEETIDGEDDEYVDYNNEKEDDDEPRVMSATFLWNKDMELNDDERKHTIEIGILHPSFEKNVTFKGVYYRNPQIIFKADVQIEYCDLPEHLFTLGADLKDLSENSNRNYTLAIYSKHEDTSLLLDARSSILIAKGYYQTINDGQYQRSYLDLAKGEFIGMLDVNNKEINYYKQTPSSKDKIWLKAETEYPMYLINGSLIDNSENLDAEGYFYLNLFDKLVKLDVNLTPDATQTLQMFGHIPDARSAKFDIWRNYEDIHVSDISYYLKMNHSRLITSTLKWRPEIKSEIKTKVKDKAQAYYESLSEGLDFWKKSITTELLDAYNDIVRSSKPFTEKFLKDFGDLSIIQQDLEELNNFLNESYQANDFYVNSVVNFSLTILNEMAISDHITSVPKIFEEIIQSMGDSGKALKEAIDALIESIKTTYHKVVELIGKVVHGDMFENVSEFLEDAIGKYDKWIKDLHISLMKHIETMYAKFTQAITNSWKRMLQNIEPSLMTFAHYVETVLWELTKEIFDFIYQRSTEIAGSPYFNQVSSFTKDLDHLYRDLMRNDAITNIKKYSGVAWDFVKDKYFKIVPFAKELNEVFMELFEELKELETLEPIQFVLKKYHDFESQVQWFIDEFKIEQRLQQIWDLLRNKLSRFAQTALQADNQYREAKTKFIFDPDKGVLELEQKLPMSWHAFNETPKFEEIPEYKFIHDTQDMLSGSNETIWNFYHDLRPLLEPTTWLPPFKSHAYLLGSRHFITFDKQFVSLDFKYEVIKPGMKPNQCSYLLARDFFNKNFTLALEPNTILNKHDEIISSRKLSLLIHDDIILIEIVGDALRIGTNLTSTLPIKIKDVIIHRDADILTIASSNGYQIKCNIQFDYCSIELSGWYYGKTAGIFGTMNNEQYDEYLTSTNEITKSEQDFINSWALPHCDIPIPTANYTEVVEQATLELNNICDSYFKNKFSYFGTCFPIIDPQPFYEMCLDLGLNTMANAMHDDHPSRRGVCTAALAYLDMCTEAKMPLRVPDVCVHCDLINGSYIPEGQFLKIEDDAIVNTTDIVFIIEAKNCNKNMTSEKSLLSITSAINTELEELGITNNRYAVMAFGGKSPFDEPRSIVYNSKIFTHDHRELTHYFNHIKMENGKNIDIFHAIVSASKLIFRPGASKTFILIPCTECVSEEMKLDYSAVMQLLLENGIKLHVLMDGDFSFDKSRLNKIYFGIDSYYAYSKKDLKELIGDTEARKQIRLPKQSLGICAPLAIETDGSVFTAKKLYPDKKNPVKKVSTIFAKRIAKSAFPNKCQICECTGHNTGVSYTICYPCIYPVPPNADYFEINSEEIGPWNWEEDDDQVGFMGKDFD